MHKNLPQGFMCGILKIGHPIIHLKYGQLWWPVEHILWTGCTSIQSVNRRVKHVLIFYPYQFLTCGPFFSIQYYYFQNLLVCTLFRPSTFEASFSFGVGTLMLSPSYGFRCTLCATKTLFVITFRMRHVSWVSKNSSTIKGPTYFCFVGDI